MVLRQMLSSFLLGMIKCVILVYDITTIAVYWAIQQPFRLTKATTDQVWSKRENPGDRNSAFVSAMTPVLDTQSLTYGCSNLVELMQRLVMRHRDKRCLAFRDLMMLEDVTPDPQDDEPDDAPVRRILTQNFKWLNYAQVDKKISDTMSGLVVAGVKPGDKVLILMENRIEYFFVLHACVRLAAVPLLVPSGSTVPTVSAIAAQSSPVCLITSSRFSDLMPLLRRNLTTVRLVIYAEDKGVEFSLPKLPTNDQSPEIKLMKLSDVMAQGSEARPDLHRVSSRPNDLALVVYSASASTDSPPAGIMITHRNLMSAIQSLDSVLSSSALILKLSSGSGSAYPAFQPLTTLSELVTQHVLLMQGLAIGYGSEESLTTQPPGCLKASKPDLVLLKPRIASCAVRQLDALRRHVVRGLQSKSLLTRDFFHFCLQYKTYWISQGFDTPIMNRFVFEKIKKEVGGRLESLIVGMQETDILSPSTESFAQSVTSCVLRPGLAMNEATGLLTLRSEEDRLRIGTCGGILTGLRIKFVDWVEADIYARDSAFPRGELWISGPSVSRGYFMNPSETEKRFVKEKDGSTWFKTGLMAEMDEKGGIRVIDRKENLIKLEMSTQLSSLGQAEAIIRSCYFVQNVCLIADSDNNFIIALVSPDKQSVQSLCSKLDIEEGSLDYRDMCQDPEVQAEVTKALIEHGIAGGLSKKMLPTKVKLCAEPWTPSSGLVDGDMRPIRSKIRTKYDKDIRRMFGVMQQTRTRTTVAVNNNNIELVDQNRAAVLPVVAPSQIGFAVPAAQEPVITRVERTPVNGGVETRIEMQDSRKWDEKRFSGSSSPANSAFTTPRESMTSI